MISNERKRWKYGAHLTRLEVQDEKNQYIYSNVPWPFLNHLGVTTVFREKKNHSLKNLKSSPVNSFEEDKLIAKHLWGGR